MENDRDLERRVLEALAPEEARRIRRRRTMIIIATWVAAAIAGVVVLYSRHAGG